MAVAQAPSGVGGKILVVDDDRLVLATLAHGLTQAGYDVIGISPDKPEKLGKFREKENLKVTLLADPEKEVLVAYGAFGEKSMYGKTVTGVIRSTVVVDEEGKVERALYNVKATGHVAKLLRDLKV